MQSMILVLASVSDAPTTAHLASDIFCFFAYISGEMLQNHDDCVLLIDCPHCDWENKLLNTAIQYRCLLEHPIFKAIWEVCLKQLVSGHLSCRSNYEGRHILVIFTDKNISCCLVCLFFTITVLPKITQKWTQKPSILYSTILFACKVNLENLYIVFLK